MSRLAVYAYHGTNRLRRFADSDDVMFTGDWAGDTEYLASERHISDHLNTQYIAILDSNGIPPGDNAYWSPFVLVIPAVNDEVVCPCSGTNASRSLFDHFTSVPYSGAINDQALYSDNLPANTFANNGDKVFAKYCGSYDTAVVQETSFGVKFNDTSLIRVDLGNDTGIFEANVCIMRDSGSTCRTAVSLFTRQGTPLQLQQLQSVACDFSSQMNIQMFANSLVNGVVTADLGTGWSMPAPS